MKAFEFKLIKELTGTSARVGEIITPHGSIKTPCFTVAATKATVKSLLPDMVSDLGGQAVLANTYHLMLQPGAEIIAQAGGLDSFMNWQGPSITDSGGFQVFSLGMAFDKGLRDTLLQRAQHSHKQLAKVDDDGVTFKSHLDGSLIRLTPEKSMELQHQIGADIHMAFDELTSPTADPNYVEVAMHRTHDWAKRCLIKHQELNHQNLSNNRHLQALFAVVQGAKNKKLRTISAETLGVMEFDGYGIGGVFEVNEIKQYVSLVNSILPKYKPKHLLGMGSQPIDIFVGVENGIDTFDCVAPTRQARNGTLYSTTGKINIKNSKYKNDFSPIDSAMDFKISQTYTKAYLHHLFKANEILASVIASAHNEFFVVNLTETIRKKILSNQYSDFKDDFLKSYY